MYDFPGNRGKAVLLLSALRAQQLNVAQKDLEEILLPALAASAQALRHEIERVQTRAGKGQAITMFIALGENRYMGGQNESSLNIDYALTRATLRIEDQTIISQGK